MMGVLVVRGNAEFTDQYGWGFGDTTNITM